MMKTPSGLKRLCCVANVSFVRQVLGECWCTVIPKRDRDQRLPSITARFPLDTCSPDIHRSKPTDCTSTVPLSCKNSHPSTRAGMVSGSVEVLKQKGDKTTTNDAHTVARYLKFPAEIRFFLLARSTSHLECDENGNKKTSFAY